MYCTVKEIIREVLDTDVPDSECVFAVVLTRGDVRHIARDWNLSDESWKASCSGWTMLLYMAHVTELFPILSMN